MDIHFVKVHKDHINIIFDWLEKSYVQEFWDNTQAHKDDILNFVNGRVEPSSYAEGKYEYWIASDNGQPYSMLISIKETQETQEDHPLYITEAHLSKNGHSYSLDYMIGSERYFGRGYGAKTLKAFIDFFVKEIDLNADTFLISVANDNPRAKHVYLKAEFEDMGNFIMDGDCSGAGKLHHLLIKYI